MYKKRGKKIFIVPALAFLISAGQLGVLVRFTSALALFHSTVKE